VTTDVAIVGAGPFGLSIAAHLHRRGIRFRIFGIPMYTWRTAMPKGMFLKSEGAGSNLSDPGQTLSLAHYCALNGLPYRDHGLSVKLETFLDYALAFQRQLVPEVEPYTVVSLAETVGVFELQLDTGERVTARRVVVAVGTTYFAHLPDQFATLPPELVSHTQDHVDLSTFSQREVVVIGGGQSALETAALLQEQGAIVRVLVRAPGVKWNPPPVPHTRLWRLTHLDSALGAGWKSWFYCHGPGVFQYFPRNFRAAVVQRALGPAGAWWLKDRALGRFPVLCGHVVRKARDKRGQACLSVAGPSGETSDILADHVIAATGYRVDLNRLPFLDAGLSHRLRRVDNGPALSSNFESSVAGLYFAGLAAAGRFGPSMRFVAGAHYTARRISSVLNAGTSSGKARSRQFRTTDIA
jgi:FAD-dependent urate hydroxylase